MSSILDYCKSVCRVLDREGHRPVIYMLEEGDAVKSAHEKEIAAETCALAIMVGRNSRRAAMDKSLLEGEGTRGALRGLMEHQAREGAGFVEIDWSQSQRIEVKLDGELRVIQCDNCLTVRSSADPLCPQCKK